jgi:CopG family transcriptional regulator, nickel-responsive regulator
MRRVTITIDDDLVAESTRLWRAPVRQGAIRDLARSCPNLELAQALRGDPELAISTTTRPKRLIEDFHTHHGLAQTTLHVHVDHGSCLAVTVPEGPSPGVKVFADHAIAERSVQHGDIVWLSADAGPHRHATIPSVPWPYRRAGEGRRGHRRLRLPTAKSADREWLTQLKQFAAKTE